MRFADLQPGLRLIATNFGEKALAAGGKKSASKKKKKKGVTAKVVHKKVISWSDIDKLHELCGSGDECAEMVDNIYQMGKIADDPDSCGKAIKTLENIAVLAIETKDKDLIEKIVMDDGGIIDRLFSMLATGDDSVADKSYVSLRKIYGHLFAKEIVIEPEAALNLLSSYAAPGIASDKRKAAFRLLYLSGLVLVRRGDISAFGPLIGRIEDSYPDYSSQVKDGLLGMCERMQEMLLSNDDYCEGMRAAIKGAIPEITEEVLPQLISHFTSFKKVRRDIAIDVLASLGKVYSIVGDGHLVDELKAIIVKDKGGLLLKHSAIETLKKMGTKESMYALAYLMIKKKGALGTKYYDFILDALLAHIKVDERYVSKVMLEAFSKSDIIFNSASIWESIIDNYKISVKEGAPLQNQPYVEGGKLIFPAGYIPKDAVSVTVMGHRHAYPKELGKEVTFVIDCSGSMGHPKGNPKINKVKSAYKSLVEMLPADKDVTYKINTFGPDGNVQKFEESGMVGTEKEELKEKIENLGVGGPSYLWANIEFSVEQAKGGGTIILYTDGISDTNSTKKKGKPEYEDDDPVFIQLKKDLISMIDPKGEGNPEGKDLKFYIICGSAKAVEHLESFADGSDNVKLYKAFEQDLKKIMDDIAMSRVARMGEPKYAAEFFDAEGKIVKNYGYAGKSLLKGEHIGKVVSGVTLDHDKGQMVLGNIVIKDDAGNEIEIDRGTYEQYGWAEYVFDDVDSKLPKPESTPAVVSLILDASNSMNAEVEIDVVVDGKSKMIEKKKIDIMKEFSTDLSAQLIDAGALVGIDVFGGSDPAEVELMPTGSKDEVCLFINGNDSKDVCGVGGKGKAGSIVAKGGTWIWTSLLLSIMQTPVGGSVVLISDDAPNAAFMPKEIKDFAKTKGIKIYYVYRPDIINEKQYKKEKVKQIKKDKKRLIEIAESTGGKAIPYKDFTTINESIEELSRQLKLEHGEVAVPLPKPYEIKIPLKTEESKKVIIEYGL